MSETMEQQASVQETTETRVQETPTIQSATEQTSIPNKKVYQDTIFLFQNKRYVLNHFKVLARPLTPVGVFLDTISLTTYASLPSPSSYLNNDEEVRFVVDANGVHYVMTGLYKVQRAIEERAKIKELLKKAANSLSGINNGSGVLFLELKTLLENREFNADSLLNTISGVVVPIEKLRRIMVQTPARPPRPISAEQAVNKLAQNKRFHVNTNQKKPTIPTAPTDTTTPANSEEKTEAGEQVAA